MNHVIPKHSPLEIELLWKVLDEDDDGYIGVLCPAEDQYPISFTNTVSNFTAVERISALAKLEMLLMSSLH